MFHARNHQKQYLFDPWDYLGPKRRKLMEESWAGLFREHILRTLPVHELAVYFDDGFGRPSKELYAVLGVLILQQIHDLTDEETLHRFAFDIIWRYALNIPEESDEAKYMCSKTLWNFRDIVMSNNLDQVLFHQTTETLAKVFQVDTSKQRLDSVHIRSNMRRLGRIGLFVQSIHTFLVNLKRQHPELFDTLEKDIIERYLPKKALSCFSLVKPSESHKSMSMVSGDLVHLLRRFHDWPRCDSSAQLPYVVEGFQRALHGYGRNGRLSHRVFTETRQRGFF